MLKNASRSKLKWNMYVLLYIYFHQAFRLHVSISQLTLHYILSKKLRYINGYNTMKYVQFCSQHDDMNSIQYSPETKKNYIHSII